MREYLFRGQRKDNGEWIYGGISINQSHQYFIILNNALYSILDRISPTSSRIFEVIPGTVGQFTGLIDNKRTEQYPEGQKIFEGDIVKHNNNSIWVIKYNKKYARFVPTSQNGSWMAAFNCEKLEVIGNIHEHLHF